MRCPISMKYISMKPAKISATEKEFEVVVANQRSPDGYLYHIELPT